MRVTTKDDESTNARCKRVKGTVSRAIIGLTMYSERGTYLLRRSIAMESHYGPSVSTLLAFPLPYPCPTLVRPFWSRLPLPNCVNLQSFTTQWANIVEVGTAFHFDGSVDNVATDSIGMCSLSSQVGMNVQDIVSDQCKYVCSFE